MTSMSAAGSTWICNPIEPRRRRVDVLTALPGHGLNPEFGHDKAVAISTFDEFCRHAQLVSPSVAL